MSIWFNYLCYFLSAWAVFVVVLTAILTVRQLRADKIAKQKNSNSDKE